MFEESTFEIGAEGRRLRVRSISPSGGVPDEAPTLVFLHEGLGSIGQWRDFPQAVVRETGIAALVYDRPGFGGSDPLQRKKDGPSLQRDDISDLIAVLDACSVRAPILVGHSDGGTIALLYAARFPKRTRGVIVEASHVFVEEATLAGIREAARAYQAGDLKEKLARYHGDKTDAVFSAWRDDWLLPQYRDWSIEASLSSITSPVLVIQGEADEYGTPAQVEAIVNGVSGRVESLLIPGCGHNPHHQAAQRVLREMKRFIAGLQ